MPRYEFREGSSSKFWQIEMVDDTSFTTTWGRIGTDGQTKTKDFPSAEKTQKEYDKLVGQKTKKGYELVDAGDAPPSSAKADAEPEPKKKATKKKATKKKATKKKVKKEAAPAGPPPAEGTVEYYEFRQGTSAKFWEITRQGTSFTVRYGKIGTDGQSKTKSFDTAEKAAKEGDKLVAQKTKKGYEAAAPAGGGGGGADDGGLPSIDGLEKEDEINDNVKRFAFRSVKLFKSSLKTPDKTAYRVRWNWDDEDAVVVELIAKMAKHKDAGKLEAIVIGNWTEESDEDSQEVIDELIKHKDAFSGLEAIFLGDITSEENEMSWICQGDFAPLLAAYPKLVHLKVRAPGQGYSDGRAITKLSSDSLRSLCLQSGGLDAKTLETVFASALPNLEHLELWLGTDNYGGVTNADPLLPLLSGKLFPKLRYLGLRNSQVADSIAAAVATSPILERIEVLDLSLGALGDEGAQALIASPSIARLSRLDVHYNFMTEAMRKKLKACGAKTVIAGAGGASEDRYGDETYRYITVSE